MEPRESDSPFGFSLSFFDSLTPEPDTPPHKLSIPYLQQVTGAENVSDSDFLEARLDASEMAFDNLGSLMPRLSMLKFTDGSFVPSLRCLGSSLSALSYLYAAQCSLNLIEGVGTMSQLKELYLAFNRISDLSPLSVLDRLTLLDIEYNEVSESAQLTYLALCWSLTTLSVGGNPVCEALGKGYRLAILSIVPGLTTIDGIDSQSLGSALDEARSSVSCEQLLITENIKNSAVHTPSPPSTAPTLPRRPQTSLGMRFKPASQFPSSDILSEKRRPLSALAQRPQTASSEFNRSFTSTVFCESFVRESQDASFDTEGNTSDLTQGLHSSLCGSLTHSLRAKRWKKTSKSNLDHICEGIGTDPVDKDGTAPTRETTDLDSVLEDLQKWRLRFDSNTNLISDLKTDIT